MRRKIDTRTFLRGLETTGLEDGLELPAWVVFQNIRLNTGSAKRRPGMVQVATAPYSHTALDFDGSADYVWAPLDTDIHTMPKLWTLELLFEPDVVTGGPHTIFSWDHGTDTPIKVYIQDSDLYVALKKDGVAIGATEIKSVLTVDTKYALTISNYEGSSQSPQLDYWLNGELLAAGGGGFDFTLETPAGGPLIAKDNGGNPFNGTIDYVTMLSIGRGTPKYQFMREINPKAEYVLFDYVMEESNSTTNRCDDRSRYRNHATIVSAPSSVTGLCTQTQPVNLIRQRLDYEGRSRLDVVAGSKIFNVTEPLR